MTPVTSPAPRLPLPPRIAQSGATDTSSAYPENHSVAAPIRPGIPGICQTERDPASRAAGAVARCSGDGMDENLVRGAGAGAQRAFHQARPGSGGGLVVFHRADRAAQPHRRRPPREPRHHHPHARILSYGPGVGWRRGETAFTAGLASFLAGHLAWIAALRQRPGGGYLRVRPALAVPHVAAFGAMNAYLWPRTGQNRVPVLVYSAALLAMSLTALDSGSPRTAAGGALFLASDTLLALEKFGGLKLPVHEGLVMATYTTAQALLAG
jgi:hypothetical protein